MIKRKSIYLIILLLLASVLTLGLAWNSSAAFAEAAEPDLSLQEFVVSATTGTTLEQSVSYASGALTQQNVYITLKYRADNADASSTQLQFAEVSSNASSYDQIPATSWKSFGADATLNQDGSYTKTYTATSGAQWKYFYFRSVRTIYESSGADPVVTYYSDKNPLHINIGSTTTASIKNVTTEYKATSSDDFKPYNGTNWIAHSVRFTISVEANAVLLYRYLQNGVYTGWIAIESNGTASRTLTFDKWTFPNGGYEGNVEFAVQGSTDNPSAATIKFDPATPDFTVETLDFQYTSNNMVSASDVRYAIAPSSQTQNLSGVKYYCYTGTTAPTSVTDSGVTEMKLENSRFVHVVSATTDNLRFMAVSGAGVKFVPHNVNYPTYIDKVTPEANVVATDNLGKIVSPLGGWGSDSIRFVVSNLKTNLQGATFEYRFEGGLWTNMPFVDNQNIFQYALPQDAPTSVTGLKCDFRITSKAGLSSAVKSYTFHLTKSVFEVSLDELNYTVNEAGWIKDPISLRFVVDSTYYDFGYRVQTGNANLKLEMLKETDGVWKELSNGKCEFVIPFKAPINGFVVSFYAINKAGVESKPISSVQNLKLDTGFAVVDIKGQITTAASGNYINEADWVNGNVLIHFINASDKNISGFKITKLIHNNGVYTDVKVLTDYKDTVSQTGIYYYRITTGAGKEQIVTYRVNIDTTNIEFRSYEVKIGENGNWMSQETAAIELKKELSESVYFRFNSNHTYEDENHFIFYYSYDKGDAKNWIAGNTTGIFLLDLSKKTDQGEIFVTFQLRSTAKDGAGNVYITNSRSITVKYNKIGAVITAALQNVDAMVWQLGAVTIQITNPSDEGVAGRFYYQYSIDRTVWQNINLTMNNGVGSFTFGAEPVHLDGIVYFRVLNSAGYAASSVVSINIKIDTTTPDPIRLMDFGDVKYTLENETLYFAANNLKLRLPSSGGYAPTRFYYSANDIAAPANSGYPQALGSWIEITEGAAVTYSSSETFFLYATNGNRSMRKKIDLRLDSSASFDLTVGFQATDGTRNEAGIFCFNWMSANKVTLSAPGSATAVKFYYQNINNNEWIPMQAEDEWFGDAADESKMIDFTFTADMNANIRFRAVNKGGKISGSGETVIIRIDKSDVQFALTAEVGEETYLPDSYNGNGWSQYDIQFFIVQQSVNPSGVKYQWVVSEDIADGTTAPITGWRDTLDMNLSSVLFSPSNEGNMIGKLWVQAKKGADKEYDVSKTTSYVFKIDKLDPNFNFEASYKGVGDKEITIQNEQWFNSRVNGKPAPVTVKLTDRNVTIKDGRKLYNSSVVKYEYALPGATEYSPVPSDFSYKYESASPIKIRFRATSEAGKVVERIFTLNIDNEAPIFRNGNNNGLSIVNGPNGERITYYVDQTIDWEGETEESLAFATVNGLPLPKGGIVSIYHTNIGSSSNKDDYGKVNIIVQDKAGNKAELKFIMLPFPLTVESITLDVRDTKMIEDLERAVSDAETHALKDNSRLLYFRNNITRLRDRQIMLRSQISEFRDYIVTTYNRVAFTLENDYKSIEAHILQYNAYPTWQQTAIKEGAFTPASGGSPISYNDGHINLVNQFKALDVLMQRVKAVQKQVEQLPAVKAVTLEDYEAVKSAWSSYQSLTSDQKSCFSTNLSSKLIDLMKRCDQLLLKDEEQNVFIEGENLGSGMMLIVNAVSENSEDYANTQRKIRDAYGEDIPRALINLVRLTLVDQGGNSSANPTGKIKITMGIPEAYQHYLYFAVYSMDSKGTVTKIENVIINPDGRSVTFESNGVGVFGLANSMIISEKGDGSKVYGTIFGIEIDAEMIVFILIGVGVLLVLLIVLVIVIGMRRRSFIKRYDRRYKQGLAARGVEKVPKGNKARRHNPLKPDEYQRETKLIELKSKRDE